jgi:hypothetical protein
MNIVLNKEVECWMPISGYEGFYEISNLGRIKSLKRDVPTKDNRVKHLKERLLQPQRDKKGYLHIVLNKGAIKTIRNVHRIVCETYHPDKYFEGAWVNHINGKKDDNRISNLEFVTASENIKHGFRVLGRKINSDYIKKSVLQYDLNGNMINKFQSITDAAIKTNSHQRGISACINNKRKTANKYIWRLGE